MNRRETPFHLLTKVISMLMDFLAVWGGLLLATWIRFDSGWMRPGTAPPMETIHRLCLVAGVLFILVFRALGLYKRPRQGRFEDTIPRTIRAIGISFVLYVAFEQIVRVQWEFSRLALFVGLFTVAFLILLERYILYRIEWNLARHMPKAERVLIVGADKMAQRLEHAIEQDPFLQAHVVRFVPTKPESGAKDLGTIDELDALITRHQITQVIVCELDAERGELMDLVVLCEERFVQFSLVPEMFRVVSSSMEVLDFGGIPVMGVSSWPLDRFSNRLLKRIFDVMFSVVALILTSPVMLLAAIAIKLTSKGPILYRQRRCGEHGECFDIYKLRTMHLDAEKSGPGWTTPGDPRRTKVGTFLRRWNIDEVPQFLNVLLGQMSVVGPRPERPHYVALFKEEIEKYTRRNLYKPGITGWAQVHGLRGDTSIGERIRYDLFYLENWSLGLDFKIVIKTVISHKNAY